MCLQGGIEHRKAAGGDRTRKISRGRFVYRGLRRNEMSRTDSSEVLDVSGARLRSDQTTKGF